jgi:hypothetical protein
MERADRPESLRPPLAPSTRRCSSSSTLVTVVTTPRASTQPHPPPCLLFLRERPPASAVSTGSLERTPTSVPSPAHARETSAPGADQCRSPWPPCSHRGRVYTEAFSSGHRSGLPHLPFLFPCNSPALVSRVQMDCIFLAGASAGYPWFSLAAVWSGMDFLRHFKLLVDHAASRLVDTVSTQLLPTVSSIRSHPEPPAETLVMVAAIPAGQAATAGAGAHSGGYSCPSSWLQPERPARQGCTAVAADQSPGRPSLPARKIKLAHKIPILYILS